MFRRLATGLPKDAVYPADMKELGYFIAPNDEIRSIENPKAYFKFFLTKNDRYNCMQREAMNEVIRKLIAQRLSSLGLGPLLLPLGATLQQPHLPIYMSGDIATKKRVIVLFYEHTQDIGVLAHRVIGGKGGINEGSVINLVKYIKAQKSFPDNDDCPGIILANMGQLRWSRRLNRAMTQTSWLALPQKTAVEPPFRFDAEKNSIPGNRDAAQHVNYIFNKVIEEYCDPGAKINVIGVSEGAVKFAEFMDDFANFGKWGSRVTAFAALATYYHAGDMRNADFGKWLDERGRAYFVSDEPCGQFLAGPQGTKRIPAHGCPCFSLNEPYYSELMLPKGYKTVINWFNEVSADAEYMNPEFKTVTIGGEGEDGVDGGLRRWEEDVEPGSEWKACEVPVKVEGEVESVRLLDSEKGIEAEKGIEEKSDKDDKGSDSDKENLKPKSADVQTIQIAIRGSLDKAKAGNNTGRVTNGGKTTGVNGTNQTEEEVSHHDTVD
ncbi:hypothetical protein HYFRA_00010699 [Hymenoscyphus fraxineus]|uniref:Arb2 domain-containing protein n=1 Tax=Hymenoscyphus fraxineus TaxID=746836 RepID=A0A9N9PRT8_9HELO|nr:hypothetical protein HYFRA_00010699 [Hymenoscyphus fraxineus]